SSFGDFYTHLGSVCDLAEDFLLSVHLCVAASVGQPVPLLEGLNKVEFLSQAEAWYDRHYTQAYEHYHKKGKAKALYLPARQDIVGGYFGDRHKDWKAYLTFANSIRQYRNKVVHDVAIGQVLVGKIFLVPRKQEIQKYSRLAAVHEAAAHPAILKRD